MQEQRQGDSSTEVPHEDLLKPHKEGYAAYKRVRNNEAA